MKNTFSNYNCLCGGTYIIWRFTDSSCKNPHLVGVCYKCGNKINLREGD